MKLQYLFYKEQDKKIFRIAFPAIAGFLGIILFEIGDIYWIGKINTKAVAGVAAASYFQWMLGSIMELSLAGCPALIAQKLGQEDKKSVFEIIQSSFWLSIIIAIIIKLILFPSYKFFFHIIGIEGESFVYACDYFKWYLVGIIGTYLFRLFGNIFNGYGDNKASNIIQVCMLILNVVLDPILMFGWFNFPKLGLKGAAIATVFCYCLGALLRLYFLIRKKYIPSLASLFYFRANRFIEVLRIGVGAAVSNFSWVIVYPLLTVLITKFGSTPLAAIAVGHRIEGIPYFISIGLSIASTTVIGNSYGKGDYEEINKLVGRFVFLTLVVMLPISLAYIFMGDTLIWFLNSDPEAIQYGGDYLRIIGYFEIFLGIEILFMGCFNAIGNSKVYAIICSFFVASRVPIAYFLAFSCQIGVNGIWWAISITTFIKGVLLVIAFRSSMKKILLSNMVSSGVL